MGVFMKKRLLFFAFLGLILISAFNIKAECKLPNDESGMIYPDEVCAFCEYLKQLGNDRRDLVLYGPMACGKTYIALKIAELSGLKYVVNEVSDVQSEIKLCAKIITITTDTDGSPDSKTSFLLARKDGVFIPLPDVEKRTAFIRYLLNQEKLEAVVPTKDVKKIINSTDGMSMYNIEKLIHIISTEVNVKGKKYSYSMVENMIKSWHRQFKLYFKSL